MAEIARKEPEPVCPVDYRLVDRVERDLSLRVAGTEVAAGRVRSPAGAGRAGCGELCGTSKNGREARPVFYLRALE